MSHAQSNGKVIPLPDSKLLNDLEKRFEATLTSWAEGCAILAEIRDKRLWEYEYDSFEAYCRSKWGIAKSRAYQLVTAHETLQLIANQGVNSTVVENEAQVRALLKADESQRVEIIKTVAAAGPITAKAIRAEIAKRNPPPPPAPAPIKRARVITPDPIEKCSAEAHETNRTDAARKLLADIRELASDLEGDIEMPLPGDEVDLGKYAERLTALAFKVQAVNPL